MFTVLSSLPVLVHLCLLPIHIAHFCPAASCYFGTSPGSAEFCRLTSHSHSSPWVCCLPAADGQGRRERPTRACALPLLIHLSSDPGGGQGYQSSREAPLALNLFLPITLAVLQILSSSLRAFVTQNTAPGRFSIFVLLFILSRHSSTLRH